MADDLIIHDGKIRKCKSLKSVVISDGVRIIGGWAFNACSSLTSVFITMFLLQPWNVQMG